MLSIVVKGYRLCFTTPPLPPWEIPPSQGPQKIQGIARRFYSNNFLVLKSSGGWRPVMDLNQLNAHIYAPHFHMHTISSVLSTVEKGDYTFKIDLQDVFFFPLRSKIRVRILFCVMHLQMAVNGCAGEMSVGRCT